MVNSQCIGISRQYGSILSAAFNRDSTRILAATKEGTASQREVELDENVPIQSRILEFEVRRGTTLGSDGQVRVLRMKEWEERKQNLLHRPEAFRHRAARRSTP
jgi:hypothetical protein